MTNESPKPIFHDDARFTVKYFKGRLLGIETALSPYFDLEGAKQVGDPAWDIRVMDYESVCAYIKCSTIQELEDNIESLRPLVVQSYLAKEGKYGVPPTFTYQNGGWNKEMLDEVADEIPMP